jgi:hypothetical protein
MIARENATNMREKNAEHGEFLIDKGTPGSLKNSQFKQREWTHSMPKLQAQSRESGILLRDFLRDCCYGIASSEPRRLFKIVKNKLPELVLINRAL